MPVITIYTKTWCSYSAAAKDLLKARGAAFEEINVEHIPEKRAEMVERAGGRWTLPQIFIDGCHVGGFDDLDALDRQGDLVHLLRTGGMESVQKP